MAMYMLAMSTAWGDPEIKTWLDPNNPYYWSYYEREDGTRVICGVTLPNKSSFVTIPDFTNTVREIAPYAFTNKTNMLRVTFPNCITNIGDYAFSECTSLQFSSLPANLTSIGKGAFRNCFLTNAGLTLPPGVERIEDYTFAGCMIWGELLSLPEGLKHIGDWGLNFDWHTDSLSIPNSVTNIGSGVFKNMSRITSIQLPSSLVNLGGDQTFYGCSKLADITLPQGMKHIGAQMFYQCTSLTNIVISDTVESIGPEAFFYCTNLTSITLPANLTNLAAKAFQYCPLQELTIPPNTVNMESGSLNGICCFSNDQLENSLRLLRLPRQFEGRLNELALFGRNYRTGVALSPPYGLEIVYYGPYNLSVASEYGAPSPAGGVNHYEEGTPVECFVSPSEIVTGDTARRCTGWTGTGDVPATGAGTNVSFTATTRNSTLKWNWETEYRIACTVSGAATAVSTNRWMAEGATFDVPFTPTVPKFRVTLGGDAENVVVDATTCQIHIPADRARQVTVEVVLALETTTTTVPVPYEWLDGFPDLLATYGNDYESFASTNAANGRKVWECYVLGLTPTTLTDFRITSFPMKANGTPDLERLTFEPPQETWNLKTATPKVKGCANLSDQWEEVPSGGNPSFRFFRVDVELP